LPYPVVVRVVNEKNRASEVVELSQAVLPRGVPPLGKQRNPNGQ
jgi:hypothetical protein